jgi:hypothetical protein
LDEWSGTVNWQGRAIFTTTGLILLILSLWVLPEVSLWLSWVLFFLAPVCFMLAITREAPNSGD